MFHREGDWSPNFSHNFFLVAELDTLSRKHASKLRTLALSGQTAPSRVEGAMNSQKVVEVFLLAENRLLREVLFRLLNKKNDIRMVGVGAYSPDVREEIVAARPNILVLDSAGLASPNAGLIPALRIAMPELRVVMVDMEQDENTFLRAVRRGVVGYVLKDASAAEVAATIRRVAAGEAVCPAPFCMALFRAVAAQQATASAPLLWGAELGLSRREQQMVELMRERLTNKEIAARLNLSEQTVKNHVHRILRKVGAPNRSSVVARCESQRFPPSAAQHQT